MWLKIYKFQHRINRHAVDDGIVWSGIFQSDEVKLNIFKTTVQILSVCIEVRCVRWVVHDIGRRSGSGVTRRRDICSSLRGRLALCCCQHPASRCRLVQTRRRTRPSSARRAPRYQAARRTRRSNCGRPSRTARRTASRRWCGRTDVDRTKCEGDVRNSSVRCLLTHS